MHYGDVGQYGLVEIDMGTTPLQRFRQKMRAFDLYLDEVQRRKEEWQVEAWVLASSYNRREELREATKAVIDEEHWRSFFFGTMLMLQPQAFGGSSWIDLSDRETSIIFEADDEDEDGDDLAEGSGDADQDVAEHA